MRNRLAIAVLVVNTTSMLAYLAWLVGDNRASLFFSRDGIISLFPVVPIVFAFVCLANFFGEHRK